MSYSIDVYSQKWKKLKNIELDSSVFCDENVNQDLIYDFVRLQRNNGRIVIACAKRRWEVAGSGKKIYRQKWTGGARAGEKRSPIRRHGGVAFGPLAERNFEIKMNKKARRKALSGLIVSKIKDGEVKWIENFDLPEIKTQNAVSVLTNLDLKDKKTLVVLNWKNENTTKSIKNIKNVKYILASYLNPLDLLSYKNILIEENAIITITDNLKI